LNHLPIDSRIIAAAAAVVIAVAVVIVQRAFQKPDDPEASERQRRFQLNQVGRIVEGLVVELVEAPASALVEVAPSMFSRHTAAPTNDAARGLRRLIRYSYSIAGVTYETAQDVTGLEERLCLERLAAGQPASVKYDPSNPSNSILVADDWSGIN
jgi:hypothetical protein